jgi:RNA polymerase sigma-70 factor (ECF subfamily)
MMEPFESLWSTARGAWPQVRVGCEEFARHLATLGQSDVESDVEGDVESLRSADLYLAFACVQGDTTALTALEAMFVPIRAALVRTYRDAALVDDALQTVRYRILVTTSERAPKLLTYRGRGSLEGWLRIVAMRSVRELTGARHFQITDDETRLADALAERDPVADLLARTHGETVRTMFRGAVAALDVQQRRLLRLEILDGISHQQIADLHDVHRTTALRWLDDVRATLAREVRRRLQRELGLTDASAQSLLRVLGDRIDLSLASGLFESGQLAA